MTESIAIDDSPLLSTPEIKLDLGPAVTLEMNYSQPEFGNLKERFDNVYDAYAGAVFQPSDPCRHLVERKETATLRYFQLFSTATYEQILSAMISHRH